MFKSNTRDTLSTIKCPHTNTTQHQHKTEQTDAMEHVILSPRLGVSQAFNHLSMGRRWMKLLVLALTVLLRCSHRFLVASKVEGVRRERRMARAVGPAGVGPISAAANLAEFIQKKIDRCQTNEINILQDMAYSYADLTKHVDDLLEKLKEQGDGIIIPSWDDVPSQVVLGTEFERLMSRVLRDNRAIGLSAVHAESGVGKSIATVLAAKELEDSHYPATVVLLQGELGDNLKKFFRVSTHQIAPHVARELFYRLEKNGIRLQIVFDDTFDRGVENTFRGPENYGCILLDITRTAWEFGHHMIAITQSKKSAEEIQDLNLGARTHIALQQQQDERVYRWSREQARNYLESMEEEAHKNEPEEREEGIDKVLSNTQIPDAFGLWRPVAISEYLNTGRKPKAPQRAPGAKLKMFTNCFRVFLRKVMFRNLW